jgi:hypothetical protein
MTFERRMSISDSSQFQSHKLWAQFGPIVATRATDFSIIQQLQ